jgi:hypothetical protein
MKARRIGLAAVLLAAGAAQAQLIENLEQRRLESLPVKPGPLDKAFVPLERVYGERENPLPNQELFKDYFHDPRFTLGLRLSPGWSLETGYVELRDRGLHKAFEGRPEEVTGALGVRSYGVHAAVKYTHAFTDRLSGFGKVGKAYSERKRDLDSMNHTDNTDVGAYLHFGAQYKLNDRTTLSGGYEVQGNAAQKFGRGVVSDGAKAKLKIGF